jgi:hypothetical protein
MLIHEQLARQVAADRLHGLPRPHPGGDHVDPMRGPSLATRLRLRGARLAHRLAGIPAPPRSVPGEC